MTALTMSDITVCNLDWDPIAAAHATSEFCTFLAGFVFAGMIVVITEKGKHKPQEATAALKLLLCAFLPLGLSAYLTGDTSGEHVCRRAVNESVLNGGMLGIGAATILVAIVWLLSAYERYGAVPLARRVSYAAFGFVALLVGTSALGFFEDEVTTKSLRSAIPWLTLGIVLSTVAAMVIARHQKPPTTKSALQMLPWVIRVILTQTAIFGVGGGLIFSIPAEWGTNMGLVWVSYILGMLLPGVSLVVLVRAMPHPPEADQPEPADPPSTTVSMQKQGVDAQYEPLARPSLQDIVLTGIASICGTASMLIFERQARKRARQQAIITTPEE